MIIMFGSNVFLKSLFWRGLYFFSVLVLNIAISRHFAAETVGEIYYLISVLTFIQMFLGFSIEASMGFYLSKRELNESQLALLAVVWTCCSVATIVSVWFLFNDLFTTLFLGKVVNPESAVLFFAGNMLISFFISLFYAKLDYYLPNILLVIINFLLFVLIPNSLFVKPFLSDGHYVQLYFAGFFIQGLALIVIFLIKYFKSLDLMYDRSSVMKPFFRFAMIASVTNLLTYLVSRIDYWFVNRYCSEIELGNYIQACKIGQLFYIIPSILAGIIFPITASGKKSEMNEAVQVLSRCLMLFYLIACTFISLVGFWLFPFVFGESFKQMYLVFILIIPGIMSYSVVHLFAAYFSGMKLLRVNLVGTVISLILVVLGDFLFIPFYGIYGAAIASSAAYVFFIIYFLLYHRKISNSRFVDFLLFRKSDAQLLIALLKERFSTAKTDEV